MIDTTSINYALSKISEGWQKAAPTLQNVSEKYVRYTVTCAIVDAGAAMLGFLACIAGIWILLKIFRKTETDLDHPGFALPVIFLSVGVIACGICSAIGVRCAVLAVANPEMYTVQSVIDAARSK